MRGHHDDLEKHSRRAVGRRRRDEEPSRGQTDPSQLQSRACAASQGGLEADSRYTQETSLLACRFCSQAAHQRKDARKMGTGTRPPQSPGLRWSSWFANIPILSNVWTASPPAKRLFPYFPPLHGNAPANASARRTVWRGALSPDCSRGISSSRGIALSPLGTQATRSLFGMPSNSSCTRNPSAKPATRSRQVASRAVRAASRLPSLSAPPSLPTPLCLQLSRLPRSRGGILLGLTRLFWSAAARRRFSVIPPALSSSKFPRSVAAYASAARLSVEAGKSAGLEGINLRFFFVLMVCY